MKPDVSQLLEVFNTRKNDIGVTEFLASELDSPHIKKTLAVISKSTGKPVQFYIDAILKEIVSSSILLSKSPILQSTMHKNIIESSLFKILQETDIKLDAAPKFNVAEFNELIKLIKYEHKEFFPLQGIFDKKSLYNPILILVPSEKKDHEIYNNIDTAAATPEGHFIFNKNFMQKLLDYAYLANVKAKGKKYKSNKGPFDDGWAYIEFLIIHEFMHFTYADFHYQKILKANNKIINYVGDYRTNYLLVKSGYTQLPIGLYSDHINYDRQKTYKEMYELVEAEIKKLSPEEEKILNAPFDEHEHDSQQDSEPDKPGKPDGDDGDDDVMDRIDKHHKKQEDHFTKPVDDSGDENENETTTKGSLDRNSSPDSRRKLVPREFDSMLVKPKFQWNSILQHFVKSSNTTEETYAKPHSRSITSIYTAAKSGSSSIKPGEIVNESIIKLLIIVDSSGSMHDKLPKCYAELKKLLSGIDANFKLIKFSDNYTEYDCSIKNNSYTIVGSATKTRNKLTTLFSETLGGTDNYSSKLVLDVDKHLTNGYNVILLTDADVLAGRNFENVKKSLKSGGSRFAIILDDAITFNAFVKLHKSVPATVTYFT